MSSIKNTNTNEKNLNNSSQHGSHSLNIVAIENEKHINQIYLNKKI